MAAKLTSLRFDQAANLVDDPANQHAKIMLFKRVVKQQPAVGAVHVDSPDWLKKDAEYLTERRKTVSGQFHFNADNDYLATKRKGWK